MIAALIRWSIANRFLVLFAAVALAAWGVVSVLRTPLDAIPDLSDTQVIIRTAYAGQAPRIVEDQVTYPLATTMMSVPGAKTVRGYSLFGDSFVYVLFEDGTDPYWARSRVLEYLNQVQSRLPPGTQPALGPDATGVGWIYQYALVDRSGKQDLGQLRALQDWFLKYELKAVPDVAEVASIGGMVRQYQIVLSPERLRAYGIPHGRVIEAVRNANRETGGSIVELGEAEYMVRASGYLKTLDDFAAIPLMTTDAGTPVMLKDVARIQIGPEMRRGIAELNGQGEVVGAVVVMRHGRNALQTIDAVKAKMQTLKGSLPAGVEVVETYDRSSLIQRSIRHLGEKLVEEFVVVALVCLAFLFHMRSAFVAIVTLPLGVLAAFIVMHYQGINANILSLGGIAIAIGAMVDAAIVMVENAHKKLEGVQVTASERWKLIADAAVEVGPALFFSLLIITLSFAPVFALQAQEGRLFSPLAYTKTYAMAAAAGLSVTLVPVLMGYLIRGRIPEERRNPINRFLIGAYRPLLAAVLRAPWTTLVVALVVASSAFIPMQRLGTEFLPALDEGDLLYMPSALPGLSPGKAAQVLQQTDKLIAAVPEVRTVFGKIGRADSATDPAPLEMVETTIQLKPRSEWRPGMTPEKLVEELDRNVRLPGLANLWVPPIRNRIDMLATGIKSPVGIKIAGNDLAEIEQVAQDVERVVRDVPGVSSVLAERVQGGRYIDIKVDRAAAARYAMSVSEVQSVVASAIGGENIGETIEGRQRFPINVRYPRDMRDSVEDLRNVPIVTQRGAQIPLSAVASVAVTDGPPMIRSENARLAGWVYVDIRGRDLGSVVADAQHAVAANVKLPPGTSVGWSGQFEYLQRATERLRVVVPFVLLVIFLLLYLTFRRMDEALLIMASLPLAVVGGFWYVYLLGHQLSVASAVGFIALAGLAAEFGVVMLVYLKQALARHGPRQLVEAIDDGAVRRVRPKAMTVAVILAGLAPIMWSDGAGSEVMQRIAAPMIGGMVTAPILSLFVIPAAYYLMVRRRVRLSSTKGEVQ
ncbi:MAG TPA: efflux RND transporter permease subunit [Burkholderiales bacterium]|nr:efflux RND transporter permease subunit [Burkholderiales bacterium]